MFYFKQIYRRRNIISCTTCSKIKPFFLSLAFCFFIIKISWSVEFKFKKYKLCSVLMPSFYASLFTHNALCPFLNQDLLKLRMVWFENQFLNRMVTSRIRIWLNPDPPKGWIPTEQCVSSPQPSGRLFLLKKQGFKVRHAALFSLYKVEVAQRPFTAPECLLINNQDSSWHQRVCCFHFFPLCFTQKEVGKKARLWSYYCHRSCSSVSYINTRVQQGLLLLWLILYN